jgi:hypothetical protein
MSGFNRKGPNGEGPMTGRRVGRCTDLGARRVNRKFNSAENLSDNEMQHVFGRRMGRNQGAARRMGRCGNGQGRFGNDW